MCLNPIKIKNVNYGNKSKLAYLQDSTAQFILVPCGRCSVCFTLKQQYITQRVQMEALNHDLYFGTLTYNNESLRLHQVGDFNLGYVDISDWQNMLKMIRKSEDLPKFRYILVTEYGGRRHRPHIHFILSFPKSDSRRSLAEKRAFGNHLFSIFLKYWRRNINDTFITLKNGKLRRNTRNPIWQPLCTFKRTSNSANADLHYIEPWVSKNGLNDVAFYVTKYALKYDKWLDKLKSKLFFSLSESDFVETWDKLRPRRLISKGFGCPHDIDVCQYINRGIQLALNDPSAFYPYFISPTDGNTYPLAPFYSKKFLSIADLEIFNQRKPRLTDNDCMVDTSPDKSPDQIERLDNNFAKVCDYLYDRHTYFDESDDNFLLYEHRQFENHLDAIVVQDIESPYNWEDYDFDSDSFN